MTTIIGLPTLPLAPQLSAIDWQTDVKRNVLLARQGFRGGDFTSLRVANGHLLSLRLNFRNVLNTISNDNAAAAKVTKINLSFIEGQKQAMQEFKDAVQNAAANNPSKEEYENIIRAAHEKAKEKINKLLDDSQTEALATIENLPPEARVTAAQVYAGGVTQATDVMSTILRVVQDVIAAVVNFLKGVWDALVKAWDTVVNAVDDAIDWLENLL